MESWSGVEWSENWSGFWSGIWSGFWSEILNFFFKSIAFSTE